MPKEFHERIYKIPNGDNPRYFIYFCRKDNPKDSCGYAQDTVEAIKNLEFEELVVEGSWIKKPESWDDVKALTFDRELNV